jgi:NAD(P)H-flavin reductase
MLKVYPGGPMSTYIQSLKVGESIEMMGPTGLHR